MKKGQVTDLIFSRKNLVCSEKTFFSLTNYCQLLLLYNKHPFPELKVEITVL